MGDWFKVNTEELRILTAHLQREQMDTILNAAWYGNATLDFQPMSTLSKAYKDMVGFYERPPRNRPGSLP